MGSGKSDRIQVIQQQARIPMIAPDIALMKEALVMDAIFIWD
jgi:hypothetical protein